MEIAFVVIAVASFVGGFFVGKKFGVKAQVAADNLQARLDKIRDAFK